MADISAAEPGTVARPAAASPPPAHGHRGLHVLAAAIATLATLLGLLFLAWLVLFVTKGRFLKPTFERLASNYTHRAVKVAGDFNFYFNIIDVQFRAEGLTVSNPGWASKPNLFEAKLIDTRIETVPLIFGRKQIEYLTLADAAIDAEWDAKHATNTWTFDPNAKPAPFEMPLIRRADVTGSTLRYRDPAAQLLADVAIGAIAAKDSRFASSIEFKGTGTARGIPFRLWGAQRSPNAVMAGGRNQFELHAEAARSRLDVAGTLRNVSEIEGADLAVGVRGQNLRTLFDAAGIAVPDTRAYRLQAHLTKQGDEYRFTRLTGNYGNSDIGGTLTVKVPPAGSDARMLLTADLASKRVDMIDLGPFIGFEPNKLATQGATAAATTQGKGSGYPRILPDAPLRVDAIKAFDAKVKYRVADIKQPFIPISNIVLGLDLDHSLLKLAPLNFDMAGGHVDSDISIDAP